MGHRAPHQCDCLLGTADGLANRRADRSTRDADYHHPGASDEHANPDARSDGSRGA